MGDHREYHFTPLPGGERLEYVDKATREKLVQWGMLGGLRRHRFTYDSRFEPYKAKQFFTELFSSREAQFSIEVLPESGSTFCRLSSLGCQDKVSVNVSELQATVTDLVFFDRITDKGLASSATGHFKQPSMYDRLPEDPDHFDLVRKMLASEGSAHCDLYSTAERNELIFRLFYHLVLGGTVCQYDEALQTYTAATASIYGKLVTPYRDGADTGIVLRAHVFQLEVKDGDERPLMPGSKRSTAPHGSTTSSSPCFTYAVVEPLRKQLTVLSYDARAGSWGGMDAQIGS